MNIANHYEALITLIVSLSGGPDKFAHTYAGMVIWLVAALALRRPLRSPLPLCIVFAAEIANECLDRISHGSWLLHDTLRDVAATMLLPCLIAAALSASPRLRG